MNLSLAFLAAALPVVSGQSANFAYSCGGGTNDIQCNTDWTTLAFFSTDSEGSVLPAKEILALDFTTPSSSKQLLVGMSGEINLVTFTEATANNKGPKSTAIAEAWAAVDVRYAPAGLYPPTLGEDGICGGGDAALPGQVTYASRYQELSVEVDLDIVNITSGEVSDEYNITVSVTVGLKLDTVSANHFNFVIDMGRQATEHDYQNVNSIDIVACIYADATGGISPIDADNAAESSAAIRKRMLTVQEVQTVQGRRQLLRGD